MKSLIFFLLLVFSLGCFANETLSAKVLEYVIKSKNKWVLKEKVDEFSGEKDLFAYTRGVVGRGEYEGLVRCDKEKGLDLAEHGTIAYPGKRNRGE